MRLLVEELMNRYKNNIVDRILLITVIRLGNMGGVNFPVIVFKVGGNL